MKLNGGLTGCVGLELWPDFRILPRHVEAAGEFFWKFLTNTNDAILKENYT